MDEFTTTSVIVSPMSSRPAVKTQRIKIVRAKYDAAKTTSENSRLWQDTDQMSARAANSKSVRYSLRVRARYERDNNSYCKGMVRTLGKDLIGRSPRLQMRTPEDRVNKTIQEAFKEWAKQVKLGRKLRTMRETLAVDGEAFGILTTNPKLRGPVKLSLKLVEADQVSTPWLNPIDPKAVDGIRYDDWGNPIEYDLLRSHPGDPYQHALIADPVDARNVIHWFRRDRPGQCRGVPEITPSVNLYAQLRRYTLAVLQAAETAADFAALITSSLPPDSENAMDAEPFETLDIERGMMTTLPAGWTMQQFKAEQPVTTYEMFKRELLNEIARCLDIPYNVAAGNSSGYNYSSGRLDHQNYHRSIEVDREDLVDTVLNPIFDAWLQEYLMVSPLSLGVDDASQWARTWFFDGFEHVDPEKEANAQSKRLESNTTTLADEYAERGLDWEEQVRQRGKEVALLKELGLTPVQAAPAVSGNGKQPNNGGSDGPTNEDN